MGKKLFILALLFMGILGMNAHSACLQPTILDGILKANVDNEGYVDYDSIRINKGGDLYQYIAFIEDADLKTCSENEKVAFWINAYNAHMIRLVLARQDLKKISDDFKLFGEKFKVAQQKYSLNDIEHRIIRSNSKNGGPIEGVSLKEFDPRIHFALVCAAVDCPKLLNRAYTSTNLEAYLQSNAIQFANNPKHMRIENDKLVVSSLMRWYADDFGKFGGASNYLLALLDSKLRPDAEQIKTKLLTEFPGNTQFKYDWTLNSVKNKPGAAAPNPKNQ